MTLSRAERVAWPRLPRGARMATLACAAMIAQQVAGKAARDALFLSSLRIEHLPVMMATSGAVSLLAAVVVSRLMVRYSPARVVPAAFVASGVALVANWGLYFLAPRASAIVLYLHTALFGAVVISAFWSLVNETFAFGTSRRAVRYITGGGAVGGLLGGLLAWRLAHVVRLSSMLLLLAALDVVCTWATYRLRNATPAAHHESPAAVASPSLWRTPYLRNLAMVVALGAVTSGLLDYAFSAVAIERFAKGPPLLAFFSQFWLVVGVLSVILEALLAKALLRKAGLAATVATLPVLVVIGSVFGVAVPGLLSMVTLRGAEAAHRNSLFRGAYELLYTPLSPARKRAAKLFIDVGADRAGTVLAGVIAMVVVALCTRQLAVMVVLLMALAVALVTIVRSMRLRRGYVSLLENSLRVAGGELPAAPAPAPASPDATEPVLPSLVASAVPLLADARSRDEAMRTLVRAAPTATGQLVDALCDRALDAASRARVADVHTHGAPVVAAEGLLRAIDDASLEVREACVTALLALRVRAPAVVVPLERIVAVAKRELDESGTPVDRRIEQTFRVLALRLDPGSMRLAFGALHQDDELLRGIALEYLETVVPNDVYARLRPLLPAFVAPPAESAALSARHLAREASP